MDANTYVLVTAAYNEERFIEGTIKAVISQARRPVQWVIVSDGSTDQTDQIVARYACDYEFIRLLRLTSPHARNFAAQVNAINAGVRQVDAPGYRFIGNLDADVSFDSLYFARLLERFDSNPRLGLAGGFIYDKQPDGTFRNRRTNSERSLAHATQLFRRECFDEIGGAYVPLPYGGPDTYAETLVRMKGWEACAFSDLPINHHRPTGSAGGRVRACFRGGRLDYSLGYLPVYELLKVLRRVPERPYLTGAVVHLAGFAYSYLIRETLPVSAEFVTFLRSEQRLRLRRARVRGGQQS